MRICESGDVWRGRFALVRWAGYMIHGLSTFMKPCCACFFLTGLGVILWNAAAATTAAAAAAETKAQPRDPTTQSMENQDAFQDRNLVFKGGYPTEPLMQNNSGREAGSAPGQWTCVIVQAVPGYDVRGCR